MADVDDLAALQDLEDALSQNLARQREIRQSLSEPQELVLARQEAASAENALAELRRNLRNLEADALNVRAKRQAGQDKLYSGTVTNPRDLQSLQAESEALSRRLNQLEDTVLQLMIETDQAAEDSRERNERLAALEASHAQRVTALTAESQNLQAQAVQLQHSIRQQRARIPDAALVRYDTLKSRKAGKAIARLRRGTCLVCGVQVPTHVVQRAQQRQEMVACPSCSRLLCPD
ncbi:MAG: zinc ribbon domain-containing protein [Anaerolineae bacterium]